MVSIRATTTAASKKVIKVSTFKAKAFIKAKAFVKAKVFTVKVFVVKVFVAKTFKAKAPFRIIKSAPPRNSRDYIYILATLSLLLSSRTISSNVIREILSSFERCYRIENILFLSLSRLSEALNKIAKLEK